MRQHFLRSPALHQLLTALLLPAAIVTCALAQPASPAAPSGPGARYADPQSAPRPAGPASGTSVPRAQAFDTLETVRQRGVLRVGIVQVPPMVMLTRDLRYVGYSIDLARRLASDIGVEVEFVETAWQAVIPELIDGRTDLILTGLWLNVPRALAVNFTQPTAQEGLYLLASRTEAGRRRTLDDFNRPGVTIVVSSDPLQQQTARARFPRATVRAVDDDPLLVMTEGRAQAAVLATLSPEAVVASAPRRWYLPQGEPLARTSVAIAVRKNDPDWLAFLNTWLTIRRDDGWLDQRARHWSVSTEGFK